MTVYISLHCTSQGGRVSPMVHYNVLNVLYAYAYTVRLHSGEHRDLAVEAAQVIIYMYTCMHMHSNYICIHV